MRFIQVAFENEKPGMNALTMCERKAWYEHVDMGGVKALYECVDM